MGGDGFKIVECIDGVLPMTTDAFGNPIADYQTVLEYPTVEEGGTQYDVFYTYKQYTVVTIKTVDLYDETTKEYLGYKVTLTITGGDSGATFVREYVSHNTHAKGDGYAGLELFVSDPINDGSGGFVVKGIYVEGVNEYNGAEVKANMIKEQHARECDQLLAQLITEITKENYAQANDQYQQAKAKYDALTEAEKALLSVDATVLTTVQASLERVQSEMQMQEKADAVDAMLSSLQTTITDQNYESMKELLAQAKSQYQALTEAEKALLTQNPNVLEIVEAAIQKYESDKQSEEQPTDAPTDKPTDKPTTKEEGDKPTEETPTKKKGCKSSIVASTASFIILGLSLVAVAIKRRKETE